MNPAPQSPPEGRPEDRRVFSDDPPVIQGHKYDGIREYDNPMPGWWVWLFVATVVFSVIYIPALHFFGSIPTYEQNLAKGQAELAAIRDAYAAANPSGSIDEATLASYVEDAARVDAGQALYTANCAACHGNEGGGLIGPNLTDTAWIHGGTNEAIFKVISEGVVEKGMIPWQGVLSTDERANLVAFVQSIQGTNPAGAKAPEGEPVQ